MDLDEYLWRSKTSQREFSDLTGFSDSTVSQVRYKKRTPTLYNALLIEKVTNGAVKPIDMLTLAEAVQLKENV